MKLIQIWFLMEDSAILEHMFESQNLPASDGFASRWTAVRHLRVAPNPQLDPRLAPEPGPDPRLSELLTATPSAATLAELEAYEAADVVEADRVVLLKLWDRHSSWIAARQQQAIVDVTGPAPQPMSTVRDCDDWPELEVAAALRLSPGGASKRVLVARELCGRLRATGTALTAGLITFWHALSVVEAVADLDDGAAAKVQAAVLEGADQVSIAGFRARLRRAVIAADPRGADERHAAKSSERRVVITPEPDGMAWLSAFVTAPEAIAAYRAIDAHARRAAGGGLRVPRMAADPLSSRPSVSSDPIDGLRADAFLTALVGASLTGASLTGSSLTGSVLPGSVLPGSVLPGSSLTSAGEASTGDMNAHPPTGPSSELTRVRVTIDLPTLLRLAENPALLDGYGDIPPELARSLAADGIWQRMIVDPADGHLLDLGRSTYRPTAALAAYVRARDATCRFPGCGRHAMRCDLDHAHPWDCEGTTCSANLGALCRRHHRAKTHAGWRLESQPDGSATWRSPLDHHYRRPAVNHAPEHVAHLKRGLDQRDDAQHDQAEDDHDNNDHDNNDHDNDDHDNDDEAQSGLDPPAA